MYSARRVYDEYEKAIVVSGDGDFYCLYEFLEEEDKLIKIIVPDQHRFSSLLGKFRGYISSMNNLQNKVGKKNGSASAGTKT